MTFLTRPILAGIFSLGTLAGAFAQTPVADYQLQNVLTSSVASGIAPLTPSGGNLTPAFMAADVNGVTQQVLTIGSTSTTILSGVQAETDPFVDPTNYSLVLLASFDLTTTGTLFTKVFDFKNLSSDAGLYIENSTGNLQFINDTGVLTGFGVPGTNVTTNQYVQLALTRESATDLVSVYSTSLATNTTTLAFSFTDNTALAVLGDATATGKQFITLFQDDADGIAGPAVNEGTQGNIARFRIYDGVLDATTVGGLDTTAVPEPTTWALFGVGAAIAGYARLRRQAPAARS